MFYVINDCILFEAAFSNQKSVLGLSQIGIFQGRIQGRVLGVNNLPPPLLWNFIQFRVEFFKKKSQNLVHTKKFKTPPSKNFWIRPYILFMASTWGYDSYHENILSMASNACLKISQKLIKILYSKSLSQIGLAEITA